MKALHQIVVVQFLALGVSLVAASAANASPVCNIPSPNADLGNVLVGKSVQQEFEVRNDGDEELTLKQKSKSCGCQAVLSCDSVEPGKTGKISIGFSVKNAREAEVSVSFETNDPAKPTVMLSTKYRGVHEVFTEPSYVNLEGAMSGKPIEIALTSKTSIEGNTFRVLQVQTSAEWIQIGDTVSVPTDAGASHSLMFKLQPSQQGQVREHITLRTDNAKAPIIEVPVVGKVAGPYTTEPAKLLFGVLSVGERGIQSVTVRRNDKQRFSVGLGVAEGSEIESTPEGDATTVDGISFAQAWAIQVAVNGPSKPGLWKKEIPLVMTLENGAQQTLLVSAVGTVRKVAAP